MSPDWIAKLDRILRNGGQAALADEEVNSLVITRFMFDDYGRPYPNRQERMREFYEKAMAVARASSGWEKRSACCGNSRLTLAAHPHRLIRSAVR